MKSTTTSPSVFLIIICLTGLIPVLGLSVQQTPEIINACEGANVSIKCHIQADSKVDRIIVLWLKNNLTVMHSESYNKSKHQLYNGNERIIATLHLHSIQLHHIGDYYCKVAQDMPILTTVYGNGTHVYIVNNSAAVTTCWTSPSPANPSEDTVMMPTLSGLGILLPIFCIALLFFIFYKKNNRSGCRAKEAIEDATTGLPCAVTSENPVVYAAINIRKNRERVKTRNENCEALVSATVSYTEDTVTYSKVHIKSKLKDEG